MTKKSERAALIWAIPVMVTSGTFGTILLFPFASASSLVRIPLYTCIFSCLLYSSFKTRILLGLFSTLSLVCPVQVCRRSFGWLARRAISLNPPEWPHSTYFPASPFTMRFFSPTHPSASPNKNNKYINYTRPNWTDFKLGNILYILCRSDSFLLHLSNIV